MKALAKAGRLALAALVLCAVASGIAELCYRGWLGARARLAEPGEETFAVYGLGLDPEPAVRAFCGRLEGLPARAVELPSSAELSEQALSARRTLRYRRRRAPAVLLVRPELGGEPVGARGLAGAWAAWLEGPVYGSFLYTDLLRGLSRRLGWPAVTPAGRQRWLSRLIDESRGSGVSPILALDESAPDGARSEVRALAAAREVPLAAVPGGTLVARLEELRAERAGCRPEAPERRAMPASWGGEEGLLHAWNGPSGDDVSSAGDPAPAGGRRAAAAARGL